MLCDGGENRVKTTSISSPLYLKVVPAEQRGGVCERWPPPSQHRRMRHADSGCCCCCCCYEYHSIIPILVSLSLLLLSLVLLLKRITNTTAGFGTPTDEQWPSMKDLPDFKKISFPVMQPTPPHKLLPSASKTALQLIRRLLGNNCLLVNSSSTLFVHHFYMYQVNHTSMFVRIMIVIVVTLQPMIQTIVLRHTLLCRKGISIRSLGPFTISSSEAPLLPCNNLLQKNGMLCLK